MDTIFLIKLAFLLLSISAFALWVKKNTSTVSIINSVFTIFTIVFISSKLELNETVNYFIGISVSVLIISWLLSRFFKATWSIFISLLLLLSFLLLNNQKFTFYDNEVLFSKSNALLIPLVGSLLPIVVSLLTSWTYRFLDVKFNKLNTAFTFILGALATLFAFTFGGIFGLVLLAIGYQTSKNLLPNQQNSGILYIFLLPVILYTLINHYALTPNTILHGSVLTGIIAGIGIISWFNLFKFSESKSFVVKFIIWILPIIFTTFLLHADLIKENLGGISFLIGVMVVLSLGFAITTIVVEPILISLISFLIFIGDLQIQKIHPKIESSVQNEKFSDLSTSVKVEKGFDLANYSGINLSEVSGVWKIKEQDSKVNFELGPNTARTKGEITKIKGKFNANNESSSFDVKIAVKNLTSFNKFRDESLMGSEFFNEPKYPTMTYMASAVKVDGDSFTSTGKFTMMGITKDLSVDFKIVKQGEEKGEKYILLVGSSKVDRTQFGMSSDPKIGDIVDFNFELELNQ